MLRQLILALAGSATLLGAISMRRVAQAPSGPYHGSHGRVVCCDSDNDSLPEMTFYTVTGLSCNPGCLEGWEHQGWNRFALVFADTGTLPGTTMATPIPFAAGDIDDDGLTDIVCVTVEPDSSDPRKFYDDVITIESPDSFSYPCSLSWYYRYDNNCAIPEPTYYLPDLDGDGHKEIFCATPSLGGCIWENAGDDRNELVWRDTIHTGYRLTFGDFDCDGRMNFASASLGSSGTMSVWECAGDNQYEVVYQDTVRQPNGADEFMTNDIDGDGKPEFYVAYENVPRGKMYLYTWEMTGDDQYARTLVDSVGFSGTDWGRISECGDIDGDGTDECIWTTPDVIKVYKAVGDNDLEEAWHWNNDHGGFRSLVSTVYDINGDGYKELITAGNAKISIFEIDAVDLLSPNGGSCSIGDTVAIRWAVNTPPRCDSLSLFLRRDSVGLARLSSEENRACTQSDSPWHLDTIAHGLPATDTLYRWLVPSGVPETARIVVIAYGQPGGDMTQSSSIGIVSQAGASERVPGRQGQSSEARDTIRNSRSVSVMSLRSDLGHNPDSPVESGYVPSLAWQFDISDSAITFIGGGVAEGNRSMPLQWSLSVSPNPARGAFSVRYDVPDLGHNPNSSTELGYVPRPVSLGIYDAGGRLVRSLTDGNISPGRCEARVPSGALPAGIYFFRLDTPGFRAVKKAVVAR